MDVILELICNLAVNDINSVRELEKIKMDQPFDLLFAVCSNICHIDNDFFIEAGLCIVSDVMKANIWKNLEFIRENLKKYDTNIIKSALFKSISNPNYSIQSLSAKMIASLYEAEFEQTGTKKLIYMLCKILREANDTLSFGGILLILELLISGVVGKCDFYLKEIALEVLETVHILLHSQNHYSIDIFSVLIYIFKFNYLKEIPENIKDSFINVIIENINFDSELNRKIIQLLKLIVPKYYPHYFVEVFSYLINNINDKGVCFINSFVISMIKNHSKDSSLITRETIDNIILPFLFSQIPFQVDIDSESNVIDCITLVAQQYPEFYESFYIQIYNQMSISQHLYCLFINLFTKDEIFLSKLNSEYKNLIVFSENDVNAFHLRCTIIQECYDLGFNDILFDDEELIREILIGIKSKNNDIVISSLYCLSSMKNCLFKLHSIPNYPNLIIDSLQEILFSQSNYPFNLIESVYDTFNKLILTIPLSENRWLTSIFSDLLLQISSEIPQCVKSCILTLLSSLSHQIVEFNGDLAENSIKELLSLIKLSSLSSNEEILVTISSIISASKTFPDSLIPMIYDSFLYFVNDGNADEIVGISMIISNICKIETNEMSQYLDDIIHSIISVIISQNSFISLRYSLLDVISNIIACYPSTNLISQRENIINLLYSLSSTIRDICLADKNQANSMFISMIKCYNSVFIIHSNEKNIQRSAISDTFLFPILHRPLKLIETFYSMKCFSKQSISYTLLFLKTLTEIAGKFSAIQLSYSYINKIIQLGRTCNDTFIQKQAEILDSLIY